MGGGIGLFQSSNRLGYHNVGGVQAKELGQVGMNKREVDEQPRVTGNVSAKM